jgi:REP element-mobilizing transposase RayT
MPDHVHGLLTILPGDASKEMRPSFGRIVGAFKSLSWRRAWAVGLIHDPFWQRGYHDRVVRPDDECHQFEWYITENPARWAAARMPQP